MNNREHTGPVIIAHVAKGDSFPTYHVVGSGVSLFVVDENAPGDRVFEITSRAHPRIIDELIPPGSEIGNSTDGSAAQERAEMIAGADPVPLPQPKHPTQAVKRELPSYLRVVK